MQSEQRSSIKRERTSNYGTFYALTDFFNRIVPKSGLVDTALLSSALDGVKRLAAAQNENAWLTLKPTVTAGVWVHYKGRRAWLLNPAQKYIRLETAYLSPVEDPDIEEALRPGIDRGEIIATQKKEFRQWRVSATGLELLWKFFEGLEKPMRLEDAARETPAHPRFFPAEARTMALELFEREGRRCPGVEGRTKPHKLTADDRIEFDHLLPYARGGATSFGNIQVLCTMCNRLKGATAA